MRFLLVVFVLSIECVRAEAQGVSADSVARGFTAALNSRNWAAAAALTDSASVVRLREMELRAAQVQSIDSAARVAQRLRYEPDLPRPVAEYQAGIAAQFPHERDIYLRFGVCSAAELAALSIREFASRWLQGDDYEELVRRTFEWEGYQARPEARNSRRPQVNKRVLGTVSDRDYAYAVVVPILESRQRSPLAELLALRRDSRGWRVMIPRGNLTAVVTDIVAEPGTPKPPPDRAVPCPAVRRPTTH